MVLGHRTTETGFATDYVWDALVIYYDDSLAKFSITNVQKGGPNHHHLRLFISLQPRRTKDTIGRLTPAEIYVYDAVDPDQRVTAIVIGTTELILVILEIILIIIMDWPHMLTTAGLSALAQTALHTPMQGASPPM